MIILKRIPVLFYSTSLAEIMSAKDIFTILYSPNLHAVYGPLETQHHKSSLAFSPPYCHTHAFMNMAIINDIPRPALSLRYSLELRDSSRYMTQYIETISIQLSKEKR